MLKAVSHIPKKQLLCKFRFLIRQTRLNTDFDWLTRDRLTPPRLPRS